MHTQYIHSLPQSRLGTANYALITSSFCYHGSLPLCVLRARFPYLYPPGTGWPSYTPGHWVPFTSSLKICIATNTCRLVLLWDRPNRERSFFYCCFGRLPMFATCGKFPWKVTSVLWPCRLVVSLLQSQGSPFGICGGQSGTGAGILLKCFRPVSYHFTTSPVLHVGMVQWAHLLTKYHEKLNQLEE
jgi:hypothetical protein